MKAWFTRVCSQFTNRRTFLKLLCDAILMALVCLLVFWVLPHDVIFLGLASVHTQFGAIAGNAPVGIKSTERRGSTISLPELLNASSHST